MKVLWCSDNVNLPTGYAQVSRNILFKLRLCGFDMHHLAFHFTHPYMPPASDIPVNYPVYYPLDIKDEQYGNKGSVEQAIDKVNPDITAFLCDAFMIEWILNDEIIEDDSLKRSGFTDEQINSIKNLGFKRFVKKFNKITSKTKTLFYFPFDSDTVYDKADQIISTFNFRVAMSKWAKDVLKKGTGLDSHVIPHGVDTNIYRPLPQTQRLELKKQNGLEGKFVIGMLSRNQTRKSWPVLLKAFAEFSKDKSDAFLFAGCDPKDPQGWDLMEFAKRLKIDNKIRFAHQRFDVGFKDNIVNMMYNILDVHVLATSGEGWGLTITESMAAGVPNILTDYTTSKEIAEDKAEYIKVNDYIVGQKNTNRALPSEQDLIKKLEKLYNKPKLRERMSIEGRELIKKKYSWERVINQWTELFEYGEVKDKY